MSPVRLSPVLGHAARRALADYLLLTAGLMLILLITAWTIDLAVHFPSIRAAAETRDAGLLGLLLPYLGYRSVDIVDRLLPMACFFGVFLAEIQRRLRLETAILDAAGAGPAYRIGPVLAFALILGGALATLESPVRPVAVFAQVDLGFGDYARRYRRGVTGGAFWFTQDDLAVRGRVLRAAEPELREVLVFTGFGTPELQTIYAAKRAVPTETRYVWELLDVVRWEPGRPDAGRERLDRVELILDIVPEELEYLRVPRFFVPTEALQVLASQPEAAGYAAAEVAIWRRWSAALMPGAFALLATALVPLGFAGRMPRIPSLIALAFLGYASVVSVKVVWTLGELGATAPWFAALGPTLAAAGLAALLIWRQS